MSKYLSRVGSSRARSLVKSITFRTVIIIADLLVIFWLTHRVDQTIALTIATNMASTILYYTHERVWNHIRWGRTKTR